MSFELGFEARQPRQHRGLQGGRRVRDGLPQRCALQFDQNSQARTAPLDSSQGSNPAVARRSFFTQFVRQP
jgi:hypothetical protein